MGIKQNNAANGRMTRSQAKAIPVVLVPGWMDSERTMMSLRNHLRETGIQGFIASPQPSNGSLPIEEMAQMMADLIYAEFGSEAPINLCGFSMGGLIHRYYMQRLGGVARVRRFVTIATPHRGTYAGHAWPKIGAQQMRPGSAFLQDLNSDLAPLEQVEFTSIWSPTDLTIVPTTSSILPVGRAKKVWSPFHAFMPFDSKVQQAVANALS
ncbi:MAG: alpha/beta fold hydrolase [Anaerolineales bacterium]|nr:alpha/beta fold hydrolase [Anaerolineales bacterium]